MAYLNQMVLLRKSAWKVVRFFYFYFFMLFLTAAFRHIQSVCASLHSESLCISLSFLHYLNSTLPSFLMSTQLCCPFSSFSSFFLSPFFLFYVSLSQFFFNRSYSVPSVFSSFCSILFIYLSLSLFSCNRSSSVPSVFSSLSVFSYSNYPTYPNPSVWLSFPAVKQVPGTHGGQVHW